MSDDNARVRARELRDGGASFRVIAETLTAEGFLIPKGGPWLPSTAFRLLQPPKPPGRRGHFGPHTEESKRKMSESHKRGFAEGRRTGQNKHNASKTHCPKGHPYDEENTYCIPGGGRACKECMRQSNRKRRRQQGKAGRPADRSREGTRLPVQGLRQAGSPSGRDGPGEHTAQRQHGGDPLPRHPLPGRPRVHRGKHVCPQASRRPDGASVQDLHKVESCSENGGQAQGGVTGIPSAR